MFSIVLSERLRILRLQTTILHYRVTQLLDIASHYIEMALLLTMDHLEVVCVLVVEVGIGIVSKV